MLLVALLVAYLLGSLNGAILLSRLTGRDIREREMAGATGALRERGAPFAVAVLLLDALKAVLAVLLAEWLAPGSGWWAVFGAVAGHCWPLYFGFRGGQGLAPLIGGGLVMAPTAVGAAVALGVIIIALHRPLQLRRLTGLGAVPTAAPVALLAALALAWLLHGSSAAIGLLAVAVLLAVRAAQVLSRPARA